MSTGRDFRLGIWSCLCSFSCRGVSIPFSMSRYRKGASRRELFRRLFKRFVLLWLFGMLCQGNLLGLDASRIYLYSNTLQSIAVGYLFAALFFVFTSWKTQIIIALALLLGYWGAMEWITIDGFGGGNYTPDGNLAEWIDRSVLGRFRDAAVVNAAGAVEFAPWYRYTWILSSLTFVVSVMSGTFAGMLLKSGKLAPWRKAMVLAVLGLIMAGLGWLWNFDHPVIKNFGLRRWCLSAVAIASCSWPCFTTLSTFATSVSA